VTNWTLSEPNDYKIIFFICFKIFIFILFIFSNRWCIVWWDTQDCYLYNRCININIQETVTHCQHLCIALRCLATGHNFEYRKFVTATFHSSGIIVLEMSEWILLNTVHRLFNILCSPSILPLYSQLCNVNFCTLSVPPEMGDVNGANYFIRYCCDPANKAETNRWHVFVKFKPYPRRELHRRSSRVLSLDSTFPFTFAVRGRVPVQALGDTSRWLVLAIICCRID
jgi:hypothetical protein